MSTSRNKPAAKIRGGYIPQPGATSSSPPSGGSAVAPRLQPDAVPPPIAPGDTVYLIVPVTVRQLSRDGYSVINSVANLNKIATRAELRTARELGL